MGMAASQGRLLSLTARMSDLELQAQVISNAKIRLSQGAQQASEDYSKALDKQTLRVLSGSMVNNTANYIEATAANLTSYQGVSSTDQQRFIKDSAGRVICSQAVADKYTQSANVAAFLTANSVVTDTSATNYDVGKVNYYTNLFNEIKESGGVNVQPQSNLTSNEWLTGQIEAGNLFLYVYNKEGGPSQTGDFENVSWQTGDNSLRMESDDSDLARAEAKYEVAMADIQSKDKRFDLELKNIDTEHTAIQTEIDSVKKVINKNIERSFKIFDA